MTGAQRPGTVARWYDRAMARRWKLPAARNEVAVHRDLAVRARDGIVLRTDHYRPVGTAGRGTVLIRTPYGRGLPINSDARLFAGQGYHVVVQSCRGTFGSGGQLVPLVFPLETDDALDTVAWLREQPWFDGRLATYGASYVGATQWALLVEPPPELRTSIVIAGPHDAGHFAFGTGAFLLRDLLVWAKVSLVNQKRFGVLATVLLFANSARVTASTVNALPLAGAVEKALRYRAPWFRDLLAHPDRADPFWESRQANAALEKVQVPVRLVGGWQDLMLGQTLRQYEVLRGRGLDVTLTVGPWIHQVATAGGEGELPAANLDWLAEHLAGEPVRRRPQQPVRIHVGGAGEWRELPEWPPPARESVRYLQPGGQLAEQQVPGGSSSFTYDPVDPTPTVAGPLIDQSAGVRDNRELEARPDVLTFTTAPLTRDLEIIGTPVVELGHRRSNRHADLFVRLCDVDREGRSRNFSETLLRLDPATGDGVVRLPLDACAHRLAAGHRLRLQVSGGSHPRYLRNSGTGAPPATATELRPCRHTIDHATSRVLLPVSPQ
ncbi:CocE/NonD family hydrolase [Amycolatopsis ultiminotia]|uniref:CocE/NonD family hydrolase n=1 Tax=Amycolatopsis ultiminotia TaxID=543629 RepID=A0ABP6XKP6_9PSEU